MHFGSPQRAFLLLRRAIEKSWNGDSGPWGEVAGLSEATRGFWSGNRVDLGQTWQIFLSVQSCHCVCCACRLMPQHIQVVQRRFCTKKCLRLFSLVQTKIQCVFFSLALFIFTLRGPGFHNKLMCAKIIQSFDKAVVELQHAVLRIVLQHQTRFDVAKEGYKGEQWLQLASRAVWRHTTKLSTMLAKTIFPIISTEVCYV